MGNLDWSRFLTATSKSLSFNKDSPIITVCTPASATKDKSSGVSIPDSLITTMPNFWISDRLAVNNSSVMLILMLNKIAVQSF